MRLTCLIQVVHRDCSPFDSRGGTVAHAYGPIAGIGGDLHFDEAEIWIKHIKGMKLFLVPIHPKNTKAIMFPLYSYDDPNRFHLPTDGICDIQSLCGD